MLRVTSKWKEELYVFDEEGHSFTFDCAWGAHPLLAYIPSVERWPECVPIWLHGRRDEVIAAIKSVNHEVVDGLYPILQAPDPREAPP